MGNRRQELKKVSQKGLSAVLYKGCVAGTIHFVYKIICREVSVGLKKWILRQKTGILDFIL